MSVGRAEDEIHESVLYEWLGGGLGLRSTALKRDPDVSFTLLGCHAPFDDFFDRAQAAGAKPGLRMHDTDPDTRRR